jgi:hypothetical protein
MRSWASLRLCARKRPKRHGRKDHSDEELTARSFAPVHVSMRQILAGIVAAPDRRNRDDTRTGALGGPRHHTDEDECGSWLPL